MMSRLIFTSAMVVICGMTAALADTLFLRNGTRLDGELLSIRNGVIVFEERRGFGRGRRIEIDRDEVLRVEFDSGRNSEREFAGGGRPAGLRERQVIVSANVPWNDSGIDVRAGQTMYFDASGEVRWGRDRRDGPGGEHNSPMNPNRPMPNRAAAALIGRIGTTSGDYFFIGDERGGIRMRMSGRLYLGVNDDFLADNSGNFRVVVSY